MNPYHSQPYHAPGNLSSGSTRTPSSYNPGIFSSSESRSWIDTPATTRSSSSPYCNSQYSVVPGSAQRDSIRYTSNASYPAQPQSSSHSAHYTTPPPFRSTVVPRQSSATPSESHASPRYDTSEFPNHHYPNAPRTRTTALTPSDGSPASSMSYLTSSTPSYPPSTLSENVYTPPSGHPRAEPTPPGIVLSPLLRPANSHLVTFDVTRPLTSIRVNTNPHDRAHGTVHDQATSPVLPSGYLILELTFPGLPIDRSLLQISVAANRDLTRLTVWDVYVALSTFLGRRAPKEVVLYLRGLGSSGGREARRAERRGRDHICWVDLLKDGTLFSGLRITGFSQGAYVMAEVLLQQQQ
ncbi:hypothetical protein PQX77_006971 [Marasmius sp. AFHP31]|nr:hypothetical protein PQX77_006971 [Marasmius sp. AFHP31]